MDIPCGIRASGRTHFTRRQCSGCVSAFMAFLTIRRWLRPAQLMWTMNPPPPCHMLVSLAQHLGNRKLFLICIFVDSKIGRTYDKHILSAQTRGRRQAIYLARTAFCFFKRKMCCCESKMWVTIYVFPTLARSSALIAVGLHLWSTSQLNSRLVKIIWLTSKTAAFNPPPQNKSWQ
jgi:hypothetical protein